MCDLGISIYPKHSTMEKDFAYMELAAKYGFTKIFTCLLSVQKPKEDIIKEYRTYVQKAHELGFEVMVDTVPEVIRHLGAKPYDLKVFHEIGFDCIRLDMSFGPLFDGLITQNSYGIEISFNGSNDAGVALLVEHGANVKQMSICHNFFPQPYTGLDTAKFRLLNERWSQLGLPIRAFITSHSEDTFGPWPVTYGLCTREEDRFLPITAQLRHMMMEKNIATCYIGNAYASEEELKACASIQKMHPTFYLQDVQKMSEIEQNLLFGMQHQGRYDCGDYMIRSIFPRLLAVDKTITAIKCEKEYFDRGDVIIVNEHLKHYQGEIQIVMKPMKNLDNHNLLGTITTLDMELLDCFKEERNFFFA